MIATSSSRESLERLKAMEADHVLNYREADDWCKPVQDLFGGRGLDRVVEVGGAATMHRRGSPKGHIALVGILPGQEGSFSPPRL